MALEKKVREGMFPGMTAKQKGMAGAVVVIFLIVIWQVMGLFGGGDSAPPVTAKSTPSHSAKLPGEGANTMPTGASSTIQQAELKQAQGTGDARFLQMQQMAEQKYMDKISNLEDLKIQREIAETNQAIAAAKLATVTAEKNISDLLTKPVAPVVSQGAYANKLATPTLPGENVSEPADSASVQQQDTAQTQSATQADYTVISVFFQQSPRKWSAVIGYGGKLYNVTVGDTLSPDNSVVVRIDENGVVLKKDGASRKINVMLAI